MKTLSVDVAVIGAGSAGMTAYRAARLHDKRVVLIEGGQYGTTCARVGCMPSKLLIAAAEAAHSPTLAPAFGVHAGDVTIDGKAVMARVQSERNRFVDFVIQGIQRIPNEDRLHGYARFLAPDRLEVGDHTLVEARSVVIATGSRPTIPKDYTHLGRHLVTSDQLFEWNDLPESVAVIGTGAIGLELGQALHRLGTRVAIFGRNGRLAQLTDDAVLGKAVQYLGAEMDLRQYTAVLSAATDGNTVLLRSRDAEGGERSERFQHVLVAAGRTPNLERLDLGNSGLELDSRGVPLLDPATMQCGRSSIFIAGDAVNERPVLHEAADQGRIAGDNAGRYPDLQPGPRHVSLAITFTDPQIATAGHSFASLKNKRFAIGEVSFEDQGRSRVMLQNQGLLRLYGEYDTGYFLGAEMIGPHAEHLIHLLAWAVQNRMTVMQMMRMPFYHPVIEEGIRTALKNLTENLAHGLPAIERCTDCTPGV
jgi:dihydrolipoamide dehydrogenase